MSRLNPSAPATSGLEWFPTRRLPRALAAGKGIGVQFISGATETINVLYARILSGTPGTIAPQGASTQIGLDVYDATSIGGAEVVLGGVAVPDSDVALTAGWEASSDGGVTFAPYAAGNGFSFVNKVIPDSYGPQDIFTVEEFLNLRMLRYRPTGTQVEGHLTFTVANTWFKINGNGPNEGGGTIGNSPLGSRLGWIEVNVACKAQNGASPTIDGVLRLNGTNCGSDDGPRRIAPNWQRFTWRFYNNPITGRQWTSAEAYQFFNGNNYSVGLSVAGPAGTDYRIGAVNIVMRTVPEHRLAVAYAGTSPGVETFYGFQMLNRDTYAVQNWAKVTGHEYLMVFYLPGGGNAALIGCDQKSFADDPDGKLTDWIGADQMMVPGSMIPSGNPDYSTWAPAFQMTTTAPSNSVDFQTYTRPTILPIVAGAGIRGEVISTHATAAYGQVSVLLICADANGLVQIPNAPLVGQLTTDTGSPSNVGGTITIQPSEVPADGLVHRITKHLSSSASLLSGTSYRLVFTSTSTVPWNIAVAYTDQATPDASTTLPGNLILDGVSDFNGDIFANITTVPAAPTGLTATRTNFTPADAGPCGPIQIGYAALDWSSTTLGTDFLRYEAERSDDNVTFLPIAYITLESSSYFSDVECRRNQIQYYRVRVVRQDGATSDYAT